MSAILLPSFTTAPKKLHQRYQPQPAPTRKSPSAPMLRCSCMTTDQFCPDTSPRRKRRSKLSAFGRTPQSLAPEYSSSPDWWRLRAAIMKALQDFPDARESVV